MNTSIPKIGFVSLGCSKNSFDSGRILTRMRAEGYLIVPRYEDADLVVVNTCGFIDAAVDESLEAIGEAMRENGRVIVTGCLGAREAVIRSAHPNVLAVTGPHATEAVMAAVHDHLPRPHDPLLDLVPPGGVRLTPRHYAYLKISEGCNHRCTFCIIPALRGDLVSRPVGDVLHEAETLVRAGVREILVIAQDSSAYGVDLKYRTGFWNGRPVKSRLPELVRELAGLGVWVRLHYVYPYPSVDALIPLMAETANAGGGQVLPYLDVPFQHASPRILKAMKRPGDIEHTLRRIEQWRAVCPDIALRSTFIVGFPGETEDDFDLLLDFLEDARLDRAGAFPYSPVEGAAANALAEPVDEDVKQDRWARFMDVQADISAERLRERRGSEMTVLIDGSDGRRAWGRTYADSPEIDGMVHIAQGAGLEPGDFVRVRITRSDAHDLWGKPLEDRGGRVSGVRSQASVPLNPET